VKRVFGIFCGVVSACGGPTTTPTPPPSVNLPQLRTGPQYLQATGYSLSNNADYPACMPFGVPPSGPGITTSVTLAIDGSDWVARSTGQSGSVELRFHITGGQSLQCVGGETIAGTIQGTGVDVAIPPLKAAVDVRATFLGANGTGPANVDGAICPGSLTIGRVTGTIHFSDSNGLTSSCPAVSLLPQSAGKPE